MSRQTRKRNRNNQISDDFVAATRNSAAQVEYNNIAPKEVEKFVPKTKNQKLAWAMLHEDRRAVILKNTYGSGKSLIAAAFAAEQLRNKKVNKIYLIRPYVASGKTIGMTPGSVEDKLAIPLAQILRHLEKFLGKGHLRYCLEKKIIEMQPAEHLRGASFENCVVIVEECQNFTFDEWQMILTRIEETATMVFTGDKFQSDLGRKSGLEETVELITKMIRQQPDYMSDEDLDCLENDFGVVEFTEDDILRSGFTKALYKMYNRN